MPRRKFQLALLLFVVGAIHALPVIARTPEEAEFVAAEKIGEDVADWIAGMERRPASIGIFNVNSNYPLEQDYSTVVEAEIMKSLAKFDVQNVVSCTECRANQVSVVNDRVVISKGVPDMETMKRIGKSQPVETFLAVEIYRTKISILAHAVLYQNPSGVLISAQKFRVTAVTFSDAATQLIGTVGLGRPLGITASELSTAVSLGLMEEMGFAKGGLYVGGVFATGSSLLYLAPTLAFRGRFGHGGIAWAFSLGAGYGMGGSSKGFTFRGALDFTLGSIAVIGAEGVYFMPSPAATNILMGFAGVHVGFALGR
jgi:hypothetical protein